MTRRAKILVELAGDPHARLAGIRGLLAAERVVIQAMMPALFYPPLSGPDRHVLMKTRLSDGLHPLRHSSSGRRNHTNPTMSPAAPLSMIGCRDAATRMRRGG